MAEWTQNVYSSMVSAIGYDSEKNELIVTWTHGKHRQTIYSGVPEELAKQLANAPSVGTMINNEIKPYYGFRNV